MRREKLNKEGGEEGRVTSKEGSGEAEGGGVGVVYIEIRYLLYLHSL
jgi:hypothetical protein